jgi:L-lactate dehydrogenase
MLCDTISVVNDVVPRLKESGFTGIIISISNPADVICATIQKKLAYPKSKIICTGTALDSSRLQRLLSDTLRVSRRSLQAFSMGEHGGSAMVPWSFIKVGGKPLAQLQANNPNRYPSFDYSQMEQAMKDGGYIVLRGKGSTEFGIATATVELIRAIFHNENKILPCSVLLDGEYGEHDVFASVPVMLGKKRCRRYHRNST